MLHLKSTPPVRLLQPCTALSRWLKQSAAVAIVAQELRRRQQQACKYAAAAGAGAAAAAASMHQCSSLLVSIGVLGFVDDMLEGLACLVQVDFGFINGRLHTKQGMA